MNFVNGQKNCYKEFLIFLYIELNKLKIKNSEWEYTNLISTLLKIRGNDKPFL